MTPSSSIPFLRRAAFLKAAFLCVPCLLALQVALLLAGCRDADELVDRGAHNYYLQLSLVVGGGANSRAGASANSSADRDISNPWGGEHGNDLYGARVNESRINTAALLFYKKSLNETDGALAGDDKVEGLMFFDSSDFEEEQAENSTERKTKLMRVPSNLQLEDTTQKYYVAVVVNITETKAKQLAALTLSQLRDAKLTGAEQPMSYNGSGATFPEQFTNFVMTSVDETVVRLVPIDPSNPDDRYRLPRIEVQRLAARIDLSFGFEDGLDEKHESYNSTYMPSLTIKDQNASSVLYKGAGIVYKVYEGDNMTPTEQDYYIVTGFKILNGRTTNTYLFKRTTKGGTYPDDETFNSTTMEVFGKEKANSSHEATNWVISPKPTYNATNEGRAKYNADYLENLGLTETTLATLHSDDRKHYIVTDPIGDPYTYYTLGYYAENTMKFTGTANMTYDDALPANYTPFTQIQLTGYYVTGLTETTFACTSDQPTYIIPVRHSDPNGNGAPNGVMRYGIVRNNIYPIRITMVVKDRDFVFVRYYYYPGGVTQPVEDIVTPFYRYIEDDDHNQPGGGDNGGYPNDAPRRRNQKPNPENRKPIIDNR